MVTVVVRALTVDDVEAAREVQTRAFLDYDARFGTHADPPTDRARQRQRQRVRHFLVHDPDGAFVAERDGEVVGVALALRRGALWGLSLLAVDPGHQSVGVGRRLLDATLDYADGTETGVIVSSRDARALHRYAAAGFALHPHVDAFGTIAPERLRPHSPRVRLGGRDDLGLADDVDVAVRGAPRGADHLLMSDRWQLLVVDDAAGRGYAYLLEDGGVVTVAATDEQTATDLLWTCWWYDAQRGRPTSVERINAGQQWAVRAAVEAGLELRPGGAAFWRGRTAPPAYLPSGPYL